MGNRIQPAVSSSYNLSRLGLLFLATLFLAAPSWGEDNVPGAAAAVAVPTTLLPEATPRLPWMYYLDLTHGYLSRSIENVADNIDFYFGDNRIFTETSGTYARINGSAIYSKGGELLFGETFRLRADLTNLNKKLHLLIASDDLPPDDEKITSGERFSNQLDTTQPVVALQIVVQEKRRWDVRLQPGLRLRTPIDPHLKLRMRRLQPLGELWLLRATLVPAWYDSRGWENRAAIDFDAALSTRTLLRFTTGALWQQGFKKNVQLNQSIFCSYILTPNDVVATDIGTTLTTVPHLQDDAYFADIRYRHNLHQGWIFGEIKAQILCERNSSFKANPALVLTVEMFFGKLYLPRM